MILVIGAGPAGLGAAVELGERCLVLEADRPGGLCRSFTVAGCTFDHGGHAFFTSDDDVRRRLTAATPVHRQPRNAWVWSHGTTVPYPFQSNLHGLPHEVVVDCLAGLVDAGGAAATTPPPDRRLDTWLSAMFGPGIYRHFLEPYNRKLWAYPLADIVPLWVGERIVTPDVATIVDGALRRRPFVDYPNAEVLYPAAGGFEELFRPLARAVEGRLRAGEVVDLDLDRRVATTRAGDQHAYEAAIVTLPLDRLARIAHPLPDAVRAAADDLTANSLALVSLAVSATTAPEHHRVYVADPTVCFHKVVQNNMSSPALQRSPHVGVQLEVSFSPHKPVALDGLEARAVDDMRRIGLLPEGAEVVASDLRVVERAYPVYTPRCVAARSLVLDALERRGVLAIGRFGEWAYINSDVALRRGIDAAHHVLAGAPHPFPRLHAPPPGS